MFESAKDQEMNSELKEQMKDYNKLKKEFEKPIEIEEER